VVALSLVAGTALADVPPAEDEGKDAGCGCQTAGRTTSVAALSVLVLGAGVLLARRSPCGKPRAS